MQSTKSSQLEKQVEGFCLVIAPLLFSASTFFWHNGEYGAEAATLIIFSMFFWIPALTGLFSLIKNKMPRYAVWGLWIGIYGWIAHIADICLFIPCAAIGLRIFRNTNAAAFIS